MSDLRNKLIRLAHQNPNLRGDLLPLIKVALTIGGRKLLKKQRDEGKVYPIDRSPFQLSTHPIFKTQLKPYLQLLHAKENFFLTLDKVTDWKIQPSSVYVDYFIDNRGLVLQINDPDKKMKAKNTRDGVYSFIGNTTQFVYVAPALKKTLFAYSEADGVWYPVIVLRLGGLQYSEGPFKGERHFSTRYGSVKKFQELIRSDARAWIPKNKVTVFIRHPIPNPYVVTSLVNVGKSKTIQKLFLGDNAQEVQRKSYAEMKAIVRRRLSSVPFYLEILPEHWSEHGVRLKHETEMDWEYRQYSMNRRDFDAMFYGRMADVKNALMSKFPEFEVKVAAEYEDGKRIDYEIIER